MTNRLFSTEAKFSVGAAYGLSRFGMLESNRPNHVVVESIRVSPSGSRYVKFEGWPEGHASVSPFGVETVVIGDEMIVHASAHGRKHDLEAVAYIVSIYLPGCLPDGEPENYLDEDVATARYEELVAELSSTDTMYLASMGKVKLTDLPVCLANEIWSSEYV